MSRRFWKSHRSIEESPKGNVSQTSFTILYYSYSKVLWTTAQNVSQESRCNLSTRTRVIVRHLYRALRLFHLNAAARAPEMDGCSVNNETADVIPELIATFSESLFAKSKTQWFIKSSRRFFFLSDPSEEMYQREHEVPDIFAEVTLFKPVLPLHHLAVV